jgi:hypothetical protein
MKEAPVDWEKIRDMIDKDLSEQRKKIDPKMNQTEYGRLFSPPLNQGQISKLQKRKYSVLTVELRDALEGRFGQIPREVRQVAVLRPQRAKRSSA